MIDYLNLTEEQRRRINERMDKKLLKPRREISANSRKYFDLGMSKRLTEEELIERERISAVVERRQKK